MGSPRPCRCPYTHHDESAGQSSRRLTLGEQACPREHSFPQARGLHNAQILLNAGFLALRDVGNNGDYGDIAVRQAIEQGWFQGPTIIGSGKIIAEFGGQSHGFAPEAGEFWRNEYLDADNPAEIRKAVHENIYYGAGVIKLVTDNSTYVYTADDIRAAVGPLRR